MSITIVVPQVAPANTTSRPDAASPGSDQPLLPFAVLPSSSPAGLRPQPAGQDCGSQGRGGDPLGADGVERADGVAQGQDPVGEAPEAVVVPQAVLGRAMAGDGGQRLGRRDRLVERRAPQAAGEGEAARLVGGRVLAVAADQRAEPAPPPDPDDEDPARVVPPGPPGLQTPLLPRE